ncbi:hypothetical protein LTR46_000861 [Exophiala xenobiotica]|nr:hypothetical protein LTR46_000861 [Exophiala xenobiotica]
MSAAIPKIEAGNLFNVNGLVAVITGGGSGLGRMMARALAANGASKVFIIGRREASLKETADSVPGGNIIPLVGDVTSKESLQQCVDKVKAEVDSIDVLVANSGISGPSVPTVDSNRQPIGIEQLTKNMWNPELDAVTSTYAVNITGIHFTVAAFLPLLDAANKKRPQPPTEDNFKPRPQIITTGSIGGTSAMVPAGVIHLTKQLSTLLIPYDIRANVIAPGLYFSEMTEGMYKAQGKVETHNVEGTFPKDVIPATRSGDDQDMAGVILWLCSRAGAYINGCTVVTDGGRLGVVPSSY